MMNPPRPAFFMTSPPWRARCFRGREIGTGKSRTTKGCLLRQLAAPIVNTAQEIKAAIFISHENLFGQAPDAHKPGFVRFQCGACAFRTFCGGCAASVMVLSPAFGSTAARCQSDRSRGLEGPRHDTDSRVRPPLNGGLSSLGGGGMMPARSRVGRTRPLLRQVGASTSQPGGLRGGPRLSGCRKVVMRQAASVRG